jgi:hypothetical protein
MRGRVDAEDFYLDGQQECEQRPNSAPPDHHQFQFPPPSSSILSSERNNEESLNAVMMRNASSNTSWKPNQNVQSPLFDPTSSSRQVWSNPKARETGKA